VSFDFLDATEQGKIHFLEQEFSLDVHTLISGNGNLAALALLEKIAISVGQKPMLIVKSPH